MGHGTESVLQTKVIDQLIQETYPEIKQVKNSNLSVFLAIVDCAVQDKIYNSMLPRSIKSGKNSKLIREPNFASAMTHGIYDILYTKEGLLATFDNMEMPPKELTLKEASSNACLSP